MVEREDLSHQVKQVTASTDQFASSAFVHHLVAIVNIAVLRWRNIEGWYLVN